jgi:hypothetical protein
MTNNSAAYTDSANAAEYRNSLRENEESARLMGCSATRPSPSARPVPAARASEVRPVATVVEPELCSPDAFAEFLADEDRVTYTRFEAGRVASKSGLTVPQVHAALQAYGYKVAA